MIKRAHSKFSASGAERWFNCQGSVQLSEGLPDKDSVWSIEGTKAHAVLDATLTFKAVVADREMIRHARHAAAIILKIKEKHPHSELLVETRVYLDFIHPEAFGTFDSAVLDHFGTLHVFDYKYGAGHSVSPTNNLQMIFYALGLASKYNWNFKRVCMWIIQPRIKGYDGPTFWEIEMQELKDVWAPKFQSAVGRVLAKPKHFVEGSWCHWCKAKSVCPIKTQARQDKAMSVFSAAPIKKGK